MEHDTPHGWLSRAAERDQGAPALVMSDGVVSYGDLDRQVAVRSRSIARNVRPAEIVAVPVHLDLASVVEILAVMRAGAVVAPYASAPPSIGTAAPDGTALCISTSGSMGAPRVVPLSYRNIASSVAASRARLGSGSGDRWLASLPLHHIGGLSVVLRSLEAGGAVVLSPFGRETASVIDTVGPTIASLVPTMVHRLLEWAPDSLATVGIVLTGGANLTRRLRDVAATRGVSLIPTYGMTETASQTATAVPGSPPPVGDVVGPLLDGFSVSIRTPDGLAESGEIGVIEVDGPAVFSGYLDEPPRIGPYRTADLGFLDADGSLGVIGRVDDVVITGGENVSLSRVSGAVGDIDGVRHVVVVGVPDPEWGTVICALVDLEREARRGDVIDQITQHLAGPEVPKRIDEGAVPLLSNGKYDIAAVQRHFAAE